MTQNCICLNKWTVWKKLKSFIINTKLWNVCSKGSHILGQFQYVFYHYDKQQHPSHVKWVLFSRMGLIAGGALALPLLNLMVILKWLHWVSGDSNFSRVINFGFPLDCVDSWFFFPIPISSITDALGFPNLGRFLGVSKPYMYCESKIRVMNVFVIHQCSFS